MYANVLSLYSIYPMGGRNGVLNIPCAHSCSLHFDGLPSTDHRKCSDLELYLLMSFSSPTPVLSQLLQKMLFKFFLRYQCGLPGSATSQLCVLQHTSLDPSQSDRLP